MSEIVCEEEGCDRPACVQQTYEDGEDIYICMQHLGEIKKDKKCIAITVFKWDLKGS